MAMPAVQDKLKTMGFERPTVPIEDWTGYVNRTSAGCAPSQRARRSR